MHSASSNRLPLPKYQVFVSSTYVDLQEARREVIWALMHQRLIPVGMENFTAADDRGWTTITRVIDDSDFYVVIVAGMYGSVDPETGLSWTEREYEYAVSKGIPVFTFIRRLASTPATLVERDSEKQSKLGHFVQRLSSKHLFKEWDHPSDLQAAVAAALSVRINEDHYSEHRRPGWLRGDLVPPMSVYEELYSLQGEIKQLNEQVASLRSALAEAGERENVSSRNGAMYTGIGRFQLLSRRIDELYLNGWLPLDVVPDPTANMFFIINALEDVKKSALVQADVGQRRVTLVRRHKEGVWGIFARSMEQLFAINLLLDDNVPLVTVGGPPGTGKSLLSMAAGLQRCVEDKRYRQVVIFRPQVGLQSQSGGGRVRLDDPWLKPLLSKMGVLLGEGEPEVKGRRKQNPFEMLIDQGIVVVEPMVYVAGSGYAQSFVIFDDAQHLSPDMARNFLTSMGEGTKVVMTGDPLRSPAGRDGAGLDGFSYVVDRMRGDPLFGHVNVTKTESSMLSERALQRLV